MLIQSDIKAKSDRAWRLAHSALCSQQWSTARDWLEVLSQYPATDYLSGYYAGAPRYVTDRVNAHNARVSQS